MLWSGSKPMTVVRENMWGFLLFAGAAWLTISWSVLRLEPADIVWVAGPVVLFGALTEAVRALAGTRTWWLNAGMAVLFAGTGVALLAGTDSSFGTPAALVGWYLMVRGAADVAVSMMTRETDRIWGLLMVVGVLETGLGFFAASPLSRTPDLVVTVLGGLALARGVADLVAALRLREVSEVRADVMSLSPERAAGVAGYSAGLSDFEALPAAGSGRQGGPRHRATPRPLSAVGEAGADSAGGLMSEAGAGFEAATRSGVRAGSEIGAGSGAGAGFEAATRSEVRAGSDAAARSEFGGGIAGGGGPAGNGGFEAATRPEFMTGSDSAARSEIGAGSAPGARSETGAGFEVGPGSRSGSGNPSQAESWASPDTGPFSYHDEVLRTTADLDAMLALAGVTGAGVAWGMAEHYVIPEVPDTAEGVDLSDTAEMSVVPSRGRSDYSAQAPAAEPQARG